jgi:chemotaxis protein histidine kinase CheA
MTTLAAALHPAEGSVPTTQQLHEQYIVAHRVRGAAALYGFAGIAQLAERLEGLCEYATAIPETDWIRAVGAMREIVQGVQLQLDVIREGFLHDQAKSVHALTIMMFLQGLKTFLMATAYRKVTSLPHRLEALEMRLTTLVPMAEQWVNLGRIERAAIKDILPA